MSTCPICKENVVDAVYTTCSARHSFCFSCILGMVPTSETLSCPVCRGGNEYIIVDNINKFDANDTDYNSLKSFIKYKKVIMALASDDKNHNCCLVSTECLLFYINNKEQFELLEFISSKYELSNAIKLIKWSNTRTSLFGGIFRPT